MAFKLKIEVKNLPTSATDLKKTIEWAEFGLLLAYTFKSFFNNINVRLPASIIISLVVVVHYFNSG